MEESTVDLNEQRLREAYEELGKLKYDDPNRGKVLDEVKKLEEIRSTYEQNETTRLNNYAHNEIDERKIEVEEQKVKNERKRIRTDWWKIAVYGVCAVGTTAFSYLIDPWVQKDPKLQRVGEDFRNLINRK